MERNTVIDMIMVMLKEVEYRDDSELRVLADIEVALERLKEEKVDKESITDRID